MKNSLFAKVLIANRGEIALRIVRALREMQIASVAVFTDDDIDSPHVRAADYAVPLQGSGPQAYLDCELMLTIARQHNCDAIHPGYGFLSERSDFALACKNANVTFIGPTAAQLDLFGDKPKARALAIQCGVPLMPGTDSAASLDEVVAFFQAQKGQGVVIKAVGGGGGRGMRMVSQLDQLTSAYERCRSEALAAFGVDGVYVERQMRNARHIEVQIIADGESAISLGERECTLQRRFQKVVEIAPSPCLTQDIRSLITADALRMAREVKFQGLGTFEFLVDMTSQDMPYVFIETNPRLQVEHTITEEITGIDLVKSQILVAAGQSLRDLGFDESTPIEPQGFAIQWRVGAEELDSTGQSIPTSGVITQFEMPAGPGIRVDTHGRVGRQPSPHYDTLLAKIIVHTRSSNFSDALRRSQRALDECQIAGVETNIGVLRQLAARPEMMSQNVHTLWLESILPELVAAAAVEDSTPDLPETKSALSIDNFPTLANAVTAEIPCRLLRLEVKVDDIVNQGASLAILEAMKMEYLVTAPFTGRVISVRAKTGDYLSKGQPLIVLDPIESEVQQDVKHNHDIDPDHIRPDLQRVLSRMTHIFDEARPEAIAKRHARGGRSARENIADLCDHDSFIEYGAFAIAAQRSRRPLDELINETPADGMITGVGSVNRPLFSKVDTRTAVLSYDPTVLAGTQGYYNHAKTDRMLELALEERLPTVLFAEGGGGRPGDVDKLTVSGLHQKTFASYAALSGQVPVIGITSGRCFAGNAALLGCSDIIIATRASNIGMGGPAMIEEGGLGVFTPEEIGPSTTQHSNGVIDVLVNDEREAVATARKYLSYFQGSLEDWTTSDQRQLRNMVPENRLRVYDTIPVITELVDEGSLLLLRTGFGIGIHTALARIEGKTIGLMASNPLHLGGAIDSDAADKAARFMQLCNAHGIAIVSLIDTPGFMVGPDVEEQSHVRRVSRMFVAAAHLRVPFFAVVLRKGYGLGAMAMAAGSFRSPFFTISWPTGEFGGMGLEGAVRLGFKKELNSVPAGTQRDALFQELLDRLYERGSAINVATCLEIDAVIDPANTRDWLARGLESAKTKAPGTTYVDTW